MTSVAQTRFGIVGSGWRGEFFLRLARLLPERLVRAGAWAREEGPAPYSLAEACQDHLISLAIEESVRTGRPVAIAEEAWAR
ncbi:hypothetical protein [Micromonospora arida]|uniref:hypothetical protein n=1 Tax=Micromonospora arida TaxID=2203715 RepID=UPI0033BF33AE